MADSPVFLNQFDQTRITFFSHKSGQFQIRLWDKTSGHAFATTCIAELHHLVLLVEGVRSHGRRKHHGKLRFCIHGWNRSLFRAWVPEATSHTLLRLNPAEHLISPISPQISNSLSNLFLRLPHAPSTQVRKILLATWGYLSLQAIWRPGGSSSMDLGCSQKFQHLEQRTHQWTTKNVKMNLFRRHIILSNVLFLIRAVWDKNLSWVLELFDPCLRAERKSVSARRLASPHSVQPCQLDWCSPKAIWFLLMKRPNLFMHATQA